MPGMDVGVGRTRGSWGSAGTGAAPAAARALTVGLAGRCAPRAARPAVGRPSEVAADPDVAADRAVGGAANVDDAPLVIRRVAPASRTPDVRPRNPPLLTGRSTPNAVSGADGKLAPRAGATRHVVPPPGALVARGIVGPPETGTANGVEGAAPPENELVPGAPPPENELVPPPAGHDPVPRPSAGRLADGPKLGRLPVEPVHDGTWPPKNDGPGCAEVAPSASPGAPNPNPAAAPVGSSKTRSGAPPSARSSKRSSRPGTPKLVRKRSMRSSISPDHWSSFATLGVQSQRCSMSARRSGSALASRCARTDARASARGP